MIDSSSRHPSIKSERVSESESSNADVVQGNDATRWVKKGRIFKEGKMREEKRNTSSLPPP
jgi:hypothetical protein